MKASASSAQTRIPSDNIITFPCTCSKCGYQIQEGWKVCPVCAKPLVAPARKRKKRANGTGSVYKMPGRRRRPWIAVKNKVVVGYYETMKEGLAALDRLIDINVTEYYNLTFSQVYELWSAEHFPGVTYSRQRSLKIAYDRFTPLYDKRFRDLRTRDFQACVDAAQAEIKTVTLLKQLAMLMYKWAIQNEVCSTDYATFIKLPKQEKTEKEIFTQEEIKKLIDDGSDDAKIALMMVFTGMRIGELFALTVDDCHGDYVIGGEKTDAGKDRIIPIAPPARQYFSEFLAKSKDGKLFSISAGSYRRYHYKALLERLEIPYKSPHSCRHTFASMAAASGMDPNVLKKIMGHSSIVVTSDVYIHSEDDILIHALDNFK